MFTTLWSVPPEARYGDNPQLAFKLDPERLRHAMNAAMAAVCSFVIRADFVTPAIATLTVTPGMTLLARVYTIDDPVPLGPYSRLRTNWLRLLHAAGLTHSERLQAEALFAERIGIYGEVAA